MELIILTALILAGQYCTGAYLAMRLERRRLELVQERLDEHKAIFEAQGKALEAQRVAILALQQERTRRALAG